MNDKCPRCNGEMKPGKAIDQTWTGTPEWEGDTICTMSPGGQGKLIDCMKCEKCGWSRRMGGIDIVEKLRSFDSDYDMHYLDDAAAEIERLQAQLAERDKVILEQQARIKQLLEYIGWDEDIGVDNLSAIEAHDREVRIKCLEDAISRLVATQQKGFSFFTATLIEMANELRSKS